MLKKRLVPVLLLKNGRMVKTKQFDTHRDTGNPVTAAKIYDAQSVDELVFLDILASVEARESLIDTINQVTEECFMPVTVGGGVKSIEDIQTLLKTGADKVSINTHAVEQPEFINKAVKVFGGPNIVISIDYKDIDGKPRVCTHGGKKATKLDPIEWAKEVEKRGAGEIMINCIDRDGMMQGYDLETIKKVAKSVNIPVIACGGAGTLKDFADALTEAGASAVAAGSIFHFTDQSPIKARAYLKERDIPIRTGV